MIFRNSFTLGAAMYWRNFFKHTSPVHCVKRVDNEANNFVSHAYVTSRSGFEYFVIQFILRLARNIISGVRYR